MTGRLAIPEFLFCRVLRSRCKAPVAEEVVGDAAMDSRKVISRTSPWLRALERLQTRVERRECVCFGWDWEDEPPDRVSLLEGRAYGRKSGFWLILRERWAIGRTAAGAGV